MNNITKTQFDELCVKPVQSKIDALRKRAETAEAQLDAVRDAYDYANYRWCEWGERAERCFELIEQALGIEDIE